MTNANASVVDVAKLLGVAPSTVSRAFNHPGRLKPETVRAVHAAAEKLGYVPNRHAQALITGRTGAIGLIVPDITNPFFPKLVRTAQHVTEQHGLSMFVAETQYNADKERAQIATMSPQTEGIIVASSRLPADELRLIARRTRAVFINNDVPGLARVLFSSRDALAEGLAHVVARGARRLCYVGGPSRSWSEHERLEAVRAKAEALEVDVVRLACESGGYEEALRLAPAIVDAETEAVIAYDDVIAHGVLHGLNAAGVRVPEDMMLLGCDDALPIQTHPQLSTIRMPFGEGFRAALGLLTAHEDSRTAEARVEASGVLVLRETTR